MTLFVINMISLLHSLDYVFQDLQTKVSYNSWLGFVSQLQGTWDTEGAGLFKLLAKLL